MSVLASVLAFIVSSCFVCDCADVILCFFICLQVLFSRVARSGVLTVDGVVQSTGDALGSSTSLNVKPPFYVGGVAPTALNETSGKIPVI